MADSDITRRRFLVAAVTFSGVAAGGIGPAAIRFGAAWAQSGQEKTHEELVRMARLLLPYEGLANEVYAEVLHDSLAAVADDSQGSRLETMLNEQQTAAFVDIDEGAQLAAMQAIENEVVFSSVLAAVKAHLYNHPAVWKVINYEGPSYQHGGYLHRGAGDIDWLPRD